MFVKQLFKLHGRAKMSDGVLNRSFEIGTWVNFYNFRETAKKLSVLYIQPVM